MKVSISGSEINGKFIMKLCNFDFLAQAESSVLIASGANHDKFPKL